MESQFANGRVSNTSASLSSDSLTFGCGFLSSTPSTVCSTPAGERIEVGPEVEAFSFTSSVRSPQSPFYASSLHKDGGTDLRHKSSEVQLYEEI